MQVQKIYSNLDILIRARYPILWVESFEEQRVIKIVENIVNTGRESDNKMIYIWSGTTGLTDSNGISLNKGSEDPFVAMETIESIDRPMVVIFKDLHRYIEDIGLYRKLRDLHEGLKTTRKTIIITSPVVNIPVELQKVITVVSLALPDVTELSEIMYDVISSADRENPKQSEVFRMIRDELKTSEQDILNAGLGLTLDEFENVIARSLVEHRQIRLETIVSEKEQIIKKSGILEFFTSLSNMDEVGGLDVLKSWIQQRKLAFSKEAVEFGLKQPKGVFLTGPPGTGKSLVAKVISKYMGMPLLRLDVSKIYGSYVGDSEKNISIALKTAEAVAPSILWLDEIEKALAGSQGNAGDGGVTARVLGSFLTWLQDHESPVFVVATSNNPTAIPPEFVRAGRFDQVFMVDLPTKNERKDIFRIHINKTHRALELFACDEFAAQTPGFSGAEIEQVIHDAMYQAYFDKADLTDSRILYAINNTKPLSQKRASEIDKLREWGLNNAINASNINVSAPEPARSIEIR